MAARPSAGARSTPARAASSAARARRSTVSRGPGSAVLSRRLARRISPTRASISATSRRTSAASVDRGGVRRQHLDRHGQAGERRAQFVAGVGQQALVRGEQRLDAIGGGVEAGGEGGDLVAAARVRPPAHLARAPAGDAPAQRLQPPRRPRHHRPGADRDHDGQQHEQQDEMHPRARRRGVQARHAPAHHQVADAAGEHREQQQAGDQGRIDLPEQRPRAAPRSLTARPAIGRRHSRRRAP